MTLENDIKYQALELGFDAAGITDAAPIDPDHVRNLRAWLKAGYAGKMDYMHRNLEKRINPAALLAGAQSVIVLALNYKPANQNPKPSPPAAPTGQIADYAQYEDYHPFIMQRLKKLCLFIARAVDQAAAFGACVDSKPLAERPLAVRAGLGFIGKNHMLINPALGPEVFLAEIVTSLKLKPDKPIPGNCSACNNCIEACPTGALRADGRFDANKCISYLTIEYKGPIPPDQAEKIGDRLFGCDRCLLACPYQKDAPACKNKDLKHYPDRTRLDLHKILTMTAESFKTDFNNSPIKRLGLDNLKRNAKICLTNATNPKGDPQ